MFNSHEYLYKIIFITGLKQLVKMKNGENLKLQSEVNKLHVENKILIDTNLNLVKGFDVLENDFKIKLGKLVILHDSLIFSKL